MDPQLITFISPPAGDWIITKKYQQEKRAILYDPTSSDPDRNPGSLLIFGWPYGRAYPVLTFTEFVVDPVAAATAVITKGVDNGKLKYSEGIKTYPNLGLSIGTRKERVRVIKQIENHPIVAQFTSSDAVNLEAAINTSIEVFDPMPTLKIDDFLGAAALRVVEAYRLWGAKQTFKQNRAVDTNLDPNVPSANLPDEICNRIEALNNGTFIPEGFKVRHISVVKIAVAPISQAAQDSEEGILIETNKNEADKQTNAMKLRANETQKQINETAVKLIQDKLTAEAKFVNDTKDAKVAENGAWGGSEGLRTLIMNGQGGPNQVQTIQVADATSN